MITSDRGLELIKRFEGCRLKAYKCPAGIWTIGYGSTGSNVKEGLEITLSEANDLLKSDIKRFEACINNNIKVAISQGQFDALVCFSFNLGQVWGKMVINKINEGLTPRMVADYMLTFCKARVGGEMKVLPGLVARREAEVNLFLE